MEHRHSDIFKKGVKLEFTAEAYPDYEFVGWFDGEDKPINDTNNTNTTISITVDKDMTVNAKFKSKTSNDPNLYTYYNSDECTLDISSGTLK